MKIYTKTGDKGRTGILGSERVDKDDIRIETYGTVDELNAVLGICIVKIDEELKEYAENIQHLLFDIGTELAYEKFNPIITEEDVSMLEQLIDKSEERVDILTAFILPGGCEASAYLHLARTVCRRAERLIVKYGKTTEINENTLAFLNRLSDLFFSWSRLNNKLYKHSEIEWKKREVR